MDKSEAVAVELGRRARRMRAAVGGALTLLGLAVGALAYITVRGVFLERVGMSSPIATGTLTVLPCLLVALAMARPLGALLVAARRPRWIDDLTAQYSIDRSEVEELASVLDRA